MAEYYTKAEADARFAGSDHNHDLEDIGGTELPANRVEVPESVAAAFDNAFTLDEALASIAEQLEEAAAPDLSAYAKTADVNTALAGKASTTHTHTPASIGAATTDHSHTAAAIGAAPASHSHDYAAPTHSHAQTEITGLEAALAAKASNSALTGKADLVDGKVPAAQLPSFVDDVLEYDAVANFPATGESGKIYVATGVNKSYRWSGTAYVEISASLALGETSATAYRGDRGKIAYDHSQNGTVHVTEAEKNAWNGKAASTHTHTAADVGAAASNHGHSYNDLSDKPSIPAAYTHPATHPASMISGLATVATSGKYSDLSGTPTIPTIPSSLPANGGNADTVDGKHASDFAAASHTHDYAASGHTHTPASIGAAEAGHTHSNFALLDHVHNATPVTETGKNLNDYRTAGIWSFANAYAPTNIPAGSNGWLVVLPWGDGSGTVKQFWIRHGTPGSTDGEVYTRMITGDDGVWGSWSRFYSTQNPPTAEEVGAMAASLQFTNDGGGVEYSYGSNSGKNLLTEIDAMPQGLHTIYSIGGTAGNPKTTESWRFLVHKTSATIGWIVAFGSSGSIYVNYQNAANSFTGWRCLVEATNKMILWSGESYLNSDDGNPQTVTPSKKLSECRTGWLLLWSDYDPGVGSNDSDFAVTMIPKYTPSGGTWGGKAFYCDIPLYVGGDASDLSTEKRCIKPVYVHDNKLVGSYQNTTGGRNDVVLRAVYEF